MSLLDKDNKNIWHPLTQYKISQEHMVVSKTEGVYLYDDKDNRYIDGISSWYTAVYGHRNPQVIDFVKKGMDQMDQVVFTGFTHSPAVQLSEELMAITPSNLTKMFFSDNGSTTVDIALKMSLQYWYNKGEKRHRIIAFEEAFHGDTFGAMAVSDLDVYNGPFQEFTLKVDRIPVPTTENLADVLVLLEELLEGDQAVCFIYEPLVQGAAAMKVHEAEHLDLLLKKVQKHGVLCIADEVMTGFGKTGRYFASDWMEHKPDLMCLSKALTCGLVPMGLTLASEKVYDAFYDQELIKGFFHGHTYSANPVACNAAIAGVRLLKSKEIQSGISFIHTEHLKFIEEISSDPLVSNPRVIGVICAFDLNLKLDRYGEKRNEIYKFFMDNGVYLRPLGSTVYMLPPYVISKDELHRIYASIKGLLKSL
ncbi:MAG: adenosylmethionine--8-amino-7-oxononanoate transaminase [Flavobacteriaceae bacterium]